MNFLFKTSHLGTSLEVQWLRLHVPNSEVMDWIPSQGTMLQGMTKRKQKIYIYIYILCIFQNLHLQGGGAWFPHLIMWVVQNDLLLKRTVWKGGKRLTSQLYFGNLTNTASARGSRSTTMVLSPVGSKYSYYIMKVVLYLWAFPPPNPQPQSNHEKSIRLIPVEEQSTKYLIKSPQNCQDHQQQGKTKKLSQPRGV